MNQKSIIISAILAIIIFSGTSFYAGTLYQKNKSAENGNFGNGRNGNFPRNGGKNGIREGMIGGKNGNGDNFVAGEIIAKDEHSITVKTRDGGTKIIFLDNSATIGKAIAGTADDLKTGNQVMVNGKINQDGTLTANNIQIRPTDQPPIGQ